MRHYAALTVFVLLASGCSYSSWRRAHSHPLEASYSGQPIPFRFFAAGASSKWHSFWLEGATIPIDCERPLVLAEKGSPDRALEFVEFSIAMPAKMFSRGRHEIAPDPSRASDMNAMLRKQTPKSQMFGGINGGAFYIDTQTDDHVDIAMDVDKDLIHLVGTFRATLCADRDR
jgi:hypothetical protein